jgi:hypothetical protein
VPERGRDGPEWWAPLSLVARELHDVQLWSMGVYNAPVEIFEEVPGLPPESALVRRTATTNGQGRVLHFPTGGGRLWWRRGTISSPTLRELVRDMSASTLRFRPASSSVQPHLLQLHDMFRPMVDIPGTDLQLVQSYRHLRLSPSSASTVGGTGNSQTLWVIDSQGHPVADAQVFSLQASGPRGSVDTEFHGFTSPGGVFPLAGVPLGTQLYVLGPDGAAGEVTLGAGLPPMIPVRLVATGRVQLAESLRPVGSEAAGILTLRFKRLGLSTAGMRPVAVRFACAAEGWEVRGLPEGAYHVVIGEDEYEVNVPAGGFVTLQP